MDKGKLDGSTSRNKTYTPVRFKNVRDTSIREELIPRAFGYGVKDTIQLLTSSLTASMFPRWNISYFYGSIVVCAQSFQDPLAEIFCASRSRVKCLIQYSSQEEIGTAV